MTRLWQPISVDARVAITIWRLGTNTEYRTIAAFFGIVRSTACEVVLKHVPGKVHDARVFVNSSCFRKGCNGTLFPDWPITLTGVKVPLLLLGDPAYPLLPWLMKPYLDNASTTPQERHFNHRLSRARMVVESSFGCLKGRWRCLLKQLDLQTSNIPNVVASCVVLHNMCEIYGDHCLQEWVVNTEYMPSLSPQPTGPHNASGNVAPSIRIAIRDSLHVVDRIV